MFIDCIASVNADLRLHEKLLERATTRLKDLKQYENSYLKSSRGKYFYQVINDNGVLLKKYLGTADNKAVKELREYRLLKSIIKECNNNIFSLKKFLSHYKKLTYESLLSHPASNYDMDYELFHSLLGAPTATEWLEQARQLKAKYPAPFMEEHKHRAMDGTLTQTKSELTYYNEMLIRGYIFVYEYPIIINGKLRFPDFAIYIPETGEIILIEHFGYMGGSEEYAMKAAVKIKDYIVDGWIPGENLLIMFETVDGVIDTEYIFNEIDRIIAKRRNK